MAELDQNAPVRSTTIFQAHLQSPRSPEERAAKAHNRQIAAEPWKFGKRCGLVVTVIGAAGFVLRRWVS